jgi:hypothetical protein
MQVVDMQAVDRPTGKHCDAVPASQIWRWLCLLLSSCHCLELDSGPALGYPEAPMIS